MAIGIAEEAQLGAPSAGIGSEFRIGRHDGPAWRCLPEWQTSAGTAWEPRRTDAADAPLTKGMFDETVFA
jgi:hypothetical protein